MEAAEGGREGGGKGGLMDKGGRKINKAGEVSRAVLLSIFKAEESEKQKFKFIAFFNVKKKLEYGI